MNEMVERVANVLAKVMAESGGLGHGVTLERSDYVEFARASIEAMREPTEAMTHAVDGRHDLVEQGHVYDEYDADPATLAATAPADIWEAMIDAALKDDSASEAKTQANSGQ